ncbi:uncharacterized protein LOC123964246 [Micropterus dolomieu]|uniref:uncharacterized protein LOC123964246 n=1 Tax=Micropterus dolomieu TaxID=147949 RepID=UPI001E8CF151|nr:uncharacterized protein LOC123964246 [Micropterus dolomieu]
MWSIRMLVSALALTLLAVSVGSWSDGNLSGAELTRLYNSPVYLAERMKRPLGSNSFQIGPISHSGVRVTLRDGSKWLIHKGQNYGISSQTVVTKANQMSSDWRVVRTGNFQGRKTVGDFVATGGSNYDFLFDNCHWASIRMMNQ